MLIMSDVLSANDTRCFECVIVMSNASQGTRIQNSDIIFLAGLPDQTRRAQSLWSLFCRSICMVYQIDYWSLISAVASNTVIQSVFHRMQKITRPHFPDTNTKSKSQVETQNRTQHKGQIQIHRNAPLPVQCGHHLLGSSMCFTTTGTLGEQSPDARRT